MATKKDVDEGVKVAPTGSPLPPEKEETEEIKTETPKTVKVGDKEYESPEALATAYQNLEGKLGEQGTELGSLRAAKKVLEEQIETERTATEAREDKEPATDYETKLQEIYDELTAGDITVEAALKQSNALTAEAAALKATEAAAQTLEDTLKERDAKAVHKEFLKDHPDYEEIRKSGKLESIKQESGGMHDDFSAYFALKATTAKEEGMAEAARLAAGDEKTQTVLTKPGESIQQTNKPKSPLSEGDLEASMLGAARAGGE